jgi:polysaccharide biosynthesis transport protein
VVQFTPIDGPGWAESRGGGHGGPTKSLIEFWPPIYRSRYVILGIIGACLALAVTALLLTQPIYRARATLEIRQEVQKVLGTEDNLEQATSPFDSQRFLQTQLDIIQSRSTSAAVAQSLNLQSNSAFAEAMGIDLDVEGTPTRNAAEVRREMIIAALQENLSVSYSNETRIAEIEFSSSDPRLSAQVANAFAENYIKMSLARRFDASRYSLDFLREQLQEAQARLGESEQRAVGYARRSRIVDTSGQAQADAAGNSGPRSITTASLVQLNQALSAATNERIKSEQKWRQAQSSPLLSIPEVLANPAVQELSRQRADLRSQLEEQLERRREENPSVRQLRARLEEIERQLTRLSGSIRDSIREEYERSTGQEATLRSRVNSLMSASLDEQTRGIRLGILQREAQTNRQQLDALLTRYNELNAQAGIQLNNISIIDRAEVPSSPIWPSLPLNLAIGLFAGLALSAAYVLLRENIFQMVRTPDDVTSRLHLPILGAVPESSDITTEVLDNKSSVSEAFSTIRTSLVLSSTEGVPRSLLFTSSQQGEGKTSTCYGLAVALAKLNRKVIVIDSDLRRPNVHRVAGTDNKRGTSNLLSGDASLSDVIITLATSSVSIIPAGPVPPNPTELLASDQFGAIIDTLEQTFDHVLIDCPPLLGLADAPVAAARAKGIIFLVESGRTSLRGARTAVRRLQEAGTPIKGVVLSRFDPKSDGYSYSYAYEYRYASAAE